MISREEVLKLAELSRLQVADGEVEGLQKDISNILEYVGQVSKVDAGKIKEAGLTRNVMREDVPYAQDALPAGKQDVLVEAFPVHDRRYNVVRKIIQKDE